MSEPGRASSKICTAVFAVLWFSCGYFSDIIKPLEHTTTSYSCCIIDHAFSFPLSGVAVSLQNKEYHTDTNGFFSAQNLLTGIWPIHISLAGFVDTTFPVHIYLEDRIDTLFMTRQNSAPVIDQFYCTPSVTSAKDDTVNCFISAHDSSGGIRMIHVDLGNGDYDSVIFNPPQTSVSRTLKIQYDSPGDYFVIVKIFGDLNDSAGTQNQRVTIANNSRPCTTYVRINSFYAGKLECVEVGASDSDGNFSRHEINWGDSTVTVCSDLSGLLWHKYDTDKDSLFDISLSLYDKNGAVWRMDTNIMVVKLNPPNLDPSIQFLPYQILGPADDSVKISVRVRDADEYVTGVVWLLNPGKGSAELYGSNSYDHTTGTVLKPPLVLSYTFPTGPLLGENTVRIVVYDNHDQSSEVWGSFSIAGK